MNKTEFAQKLKATINAKYKNGDRLQDDIINLAQTINLLDIIEQAIDIQLSSAGKLNLGIGCLKLEQTKERKVMHPTTKQMITIPSKLTVKFVPSTKFLESLAASQSVLAPEIEVKPVSVVQKA